MYTYKYENTVKYFFFLRLSFDSPVLVVFCLIIIEIFKFQLISIHAWLLHIRTSIKIDIYSVKFYIIGCRSTIRSQQSMT